MNHKTDASVKTKNTAAGKAVADASLKQMFSGEHMREYYQIANIHCGSCVSRIENSLKDLPGIVSVHVDLISRSVEVEYQKDVAVPADFRLAIESTGHRVADPLPR